MNLNNKLHSEKFMWKALWTGVRLPSSPPKTYLFELIKQIDTKINQKINLVDL